MPLPCVSTLGTSDFSLVCSAPNVLYHIVVCPFDLGLSEFRKSLAYLYNSCLEFISWFHNQNRLNCLVDSCLLIDVLFLTLSIVLDASFIAFWIASCLACSFSSSVNSTTWLTTIFPFIGLPTSMSSSSKKTRALVFYDYPNLYKNLTFGINSL